MLLLVSTFPTQMSVFKCEQSRVVKGTECLGEGGGVGVGVGVGVRVGYVLRASCPRV